MNVLVDTDVTFTLSGENRKVVVDALELDEFVQSLWGEPSPKTDDNGQAVMKDGEAVMVRQIGWEVVDEKFGGWLKERANGMTPPLKKSEIRGIWENSADVWLKKNTSWRKPVQESASPTSPPSTDARYSD